MRSPADPSAALCPAWLLTGTEVKAAKTIAFVFLPVLAVYLISGDYLGRSETGPPFPNSK